VYENWQLAFFAVPDAASFFIQDRVKEMLGWYFFHGSYSGDDSVSNDLFEVYTRSLSKPGFLRAMLQYFAACFEDEKYFQGKINATGKMQMPVLAMGGEASFSPAKVLRGAFEPVAADLQTAVVPKAGHWIVSFSTDQLCWTTF
jgi:pimeloyl-ACP methyl ester carboxylesterase